MKKVTLKMQILNSENLDTIPIACRKNKNIVIKTVVFSSSFYGISTAKRRMSTISI